jgi:hypothetical protein
MLRTAVVFNLDAVVQQAVKQGSRPTKGEIKPSPAPHAHSSST